MEPLIQERLTPDVPITRVEFTTFSLGTIAPQVGAQGQDAHTAASSGRLMREQPTERC